MKLHSWAIVTAVLTLKDGSLAAGLMNPIDRSSYTRQGNATWVISCPVTGSGSLRMSPTSNRIYQIFLFTSFYSLRQLLSKMESKSFVR